MNCPSCGNSIEIHQPGRCLDAWIAEKVMGWKRRDDKAHRVLSDSEIEIIGPGWEAPFNDELVTLYPIAPSFSTDIAAAWKVISKIGAGFDLCFIPDSRAWSAQFYASGIPRGASGATAPFAICLAALKAVEELEKDKNP